MVYEHTWRDRRNEVGFAAAYARATLILYKGPHETDLIRAIELAEAYAEGAEIDQEVAERSRRMTNQAITAAGGRIHDGFPRGGPKHSAYVAADTARVAITLVCRPEIALGAPPVPARHIGGGVHVFDQVFVRWVARDCGFALETREQIHAAVAALHANALELIAEIGVRT